MALKCDVSLCRLCCLMILCAAAFGLTRFGHAQRID